MFYLRHIVSRPFLVGALALGLTLPLGCGPVEYVALVGGRASSALAQARREKADQLAPYEYTAAGEYLKKAKEEAGRSQYQTALRYGRLAEELADRSRALSRERKAGRSLGVDPQAPKTPVELPKRDNRRGGDGSQDGSQDGIEDGIEDGSDIDEEFHIPVPRRDDESTRQREPRS